jgi:two-component system sensor histidine kinase QseC
MALLEAQVAEAQQNGRIGDKLATSILCEIFEVSETVTTFLTWAEVENATGQKRLHVIRAFKLVEDIAARLESTFPGRVELNLIDDFNVMSNIQHLEQALNNLIFNALVYSPANETVRVIVGERTIRVVDRGSGIPSEVMQRFGEPFNKGEGQRASLNRKANGLGLALVQSISKLYEWNLRISTDSSGTRACIAFPNLPEQMEFA